MKEITSPDDFYLDVIKPRPLLAIFVAEWCGDCHFIAPDLPILEKEFASSADFVTVDIDRQADIAKAHAVIGIPSFIFFHNGREIYRLVNTNRKTKEEVEDFINKGLALLA